MIVCAAIKLIQRELYDEKLSVPKELVVCGHRHGDCFKIIQELGPQWCHTEKIEGFINHLGNFLNRKDAYQYAWECGQLNNHNKWYRKDNKIPNELYSEDLY